MLARFYEVTVPSTTDIGIAAPPAVVQARVNAVIALMSSQFGGATVVPAQGAYVSESGELVEEQVYLVRSYAHYTDSAWAKNHLPGLLQAFAEDWGQECVALTTNWGMTFHYPKTREAVA